MKTTIMVVDDEQNVLNLVETILKDQGYRVIKASSGKECLEKISKVRPDLIVMDQMMPYMSGIDSVRQIRKRPNGKGIPIIFSTIVMFNDEGKKTLKELGIIDCIAKPFEHEDFLNRVKQALK